MHKLVAGTVLIRCAMFMPAVDARETAPQTSASPSWTRRRTVDGQPDMQGLWNSTAGWASVSVERVAGARTGGMGRSDATLVIDPPDGRIPYQPWARARKEAILDKFLNPDTNSLDPQTRDWPSGV